MKIKRKRLPHVEYTCPKCRKVMKGYKFGDTCKHCGWYQKPLPR